MKSSDGSSPKASGLATPLGFVLVLVGLAWGAQGIGVLKGSVMTDQTLWAIVGPVTAAVGLVLVLLGLRRKED